ncbi:ABC transporter ATP-binding protein, partial [Bacillus thuringiensis]
MLKVQNIDVYYGNIQALKGLSLEVNEGEIVTLIGANGAGKSTLLKTLSGLLKPKGGIIEYEGFSIAGKAAQTIVKSGISHVPEGRRVFANMSVEENLELGAYLRNDKAGIKKDMDHVFELFPRLMERRKQLSG